MITTLALVASLSCNKDGSEPLDTDSCNDACDHEDSDSGSDGDEG